MKTAEIRVTDQAGVRLDVFIADYMGLFSRSQAKARVAEVRVNGKPVRLSHRLRRGDDVRVEYTDPPPLELLAQDIPLPVIFENDDVIVIDKPQGMVVHPGSGNPTGTMVNALLFHCQGLQACFGDAEIRPGIVHRLDKDTSGVIIAAKNPKAHEFLAQQFKSREVRKRYLAILNGLPPDGRGKVETLIVRDSAHRKRFVCSTGKGRLAVTYYKVLRAFIPVVAGRQSRRNAYSFVSFLPRTGRTHQLRVHARHLSAPILGDPLYGRHDERFPSCTLMLHAYSLTIRLPGETQSRTFVSRVPRRFVQMLKALQSLSPR